MIVAGLLFFACNENNSKSNKKIDDPIHSPQLEQNDTSNRMDTTMHDRIDSAHHTRPRSE